MVLRRPFEPAAFIRHVEAGRLVGLNLYSKGYGALDFYSRLQGWHVHKPVPSSQLSGGADKVGEGVSGSSWFIYRPKDKSETYRRLPRQIRAPYRNCQRAKCLVLEPVGKEDGGAHHKNGWKVNLRHLYG